MTQTADQERTLGRLFADASRDLSALVRDEIQLAKTELRADVSGAAKAAGMFGAAGFVAVVAFILLSIAAAYGLTALGLHPALAFLLVAVVYLIVAAILAFVGKKTISKVRPPERTIETTKESVAVLKGGTSALR
jgi:hypothetical protein